LTTLAVTALLCGATTDTSLRDDKTGGLIATAAAAATTFDVWPVFPDPGHAGSSDVSQRAFGDFWRETYTGQMPFLSPNQQWAT